MSIENFEEITSAGTSKGELEGNSETNPEEIESLERDASALCEETIQLTQTLTDQTFMQRFLELQETNTALTEKLYAIRRSWDDVVQRATGLVSLSLTAVGVTNVATAFGMNADLYRGSEMTLVAGAVIAAGYAISALAHTLKEKSVEVERGSVIDELSKAMEHIGDSDINEYYGFKTRTD